MTRTSRAPSARASPARNDDAATTIRARRTSGRASQGARRASATSVPHTWSTNGLPVARAAIADGIQCACTRSASRAAVAPPARTPRGTPAREPAPRPRAQVLHDPAAVGDPEVRGTTPARRPRPRRRAARGPHRRGDEVAGHVAPSRGYDVVRTTTFIRPPARRRAGRRARARGTRRSNRTASSGRRRSTAIVPASAAVSPRRAGARARRADRAPLQRAAERAGDAEAAEDPDEEDPEQQPSRRGRLDDQGDVERVRPPVRLAGHELVVDGEMFSPSPNSGSMCRMSGMKS